MSRRMSNGEAQVRVSLDEIRRGLTRWRIHDLRSTRSIRFVSVIVIAVMAVLAGCGGPTGIAAWADRQKDCLCESFSSAERGSPARMFFGSRPDGD